jgi:hypothetical protein
MYSPALLDYLHRLILPPGTVPPSMEAEEEYDFSTRGKVTEDIEQNKEWNTVEKDRKDRDRRSKARTKIKQRLTKIDPPKDYSTFDSDEEESEEKEEAKVEKIGEIVIKIETEEDDEEDVISKPVEDEEDVLSKLEEKELEYIYNLLFN